MYWKELLSMLAHSKMKVGDLRSKVAPENWLPRSLKLRYNLLKSSVQTALPSALGGVLAGSRLQKEAREAGIEYNKNVVLSGMFYGVNKVQQRNQKMIMRKQRKEGFGLLSQFAQASKEGSKFGVKYSISNPNKTQQANVSFVYNKLRTEKEQMEGALTKGSLSREKRVDYDRRLDKIDTTIRYIEELTNKGNAFEKPHWKSTGNFAIDKVLTQIDLTKVHKENKRLLDTDKENELTDKVVNELVEDVYEAEQKAKYFEKNIAKEFFDEAGTTARKTVRDIKRTVEKGFEEVTKGKELESLRTRAKEVVYENNKEEITDYIEKTSMSEERKEGVKEIFHKVLEVDQKLNKTKEKSIERELVEKPKEYNLGKNFFKARISKEREKDLLRQQLKGTVEDESTKDEENL